MILSSQRRIIIMGCYSNSLCEQAAENADLKTCDMIWWQCGWNPQSFYFFLITTKYHIVLLAKSFSIFVRVFCSYISILMRYGKIFFKTWACTGTHVLVKKFIFNKMFSIFFILITRFYFYYTLSSLLKIVLRSVKNSANYKQNIYKNSVILY